MARMVIGGVLVLVMCVGSEQPPWGASETSCQTVCLCDNLSVRCASGDLDTVPVDLDYYISRLELPHNRIKYVGNMEAYSSLEWLDLSHNFIVEIKPHCFTESRLMTALSLRGNRLGTLDQSDLIGLTGLVDLDLSQNSIDNISEGAFQHQTNLQSLNLTNNRLSSLSSQIFLGSVKETLRTLYLAHNLLSTVPREALTGLVDLDVLDLSYNNIMKVNSGEFLGLGGSLSELKMEGCGLYEVGPVAFQGISSLRRLDLQNNLLDKVPNRAFVNLPLLETLWIGRNRIKKLGKNDLLSLKQLKFLYLEGCKSVESFSLRSGVFEANTNLVSITIKCPELDISPQVSLSHLSELSILSLSGCGLSYLPEHFVNYLDLDILDVSSNILVCDCNLRFLLDVLRSNPSLSLIGACDNPDQFHGKELRDLIRHEKDFVCESDALSKSEFGALIGGVVIGVILILIGIYFWTNKRPWVLSLFNRKEKKRLSAGPNFTGSKKDIKVIQKEVPDSDSMIPLKPGNLEQEYSEPVYETIPPYTIPASNFPDVKVSVL